MAFYKPVEVNDVHSRLNATHVAGIAAPGSVDELLDCFKPIREAKKSLAISGGRHAMGGQQFASDELLLDLRGLARLVSFDEKKGLAEFEAGATWPTVVNGIRSKSNYWAIRQKQTGADDLTLGGSLSANGHGRGLRYSPIADDVERLTLLAADGSLLTCDRQNNAELFSLVCGGYGLFGIIVTVTLRLMPRQKLRRLVDVLDIDDAIPAAFRKAEQGFLYGDFQYAIDPADDSFLRRGVFASYTPAGESADEPDSSTDLKPEDWGKLLSLAHTDKRAAFALYSQHYLASHGRVYWSDTMQLATYIPSYDQFLSEPEHPHSLMIGELYIPPQQLPEFLSRSRRILREDKSEDIYGTLRSIWPDRTSFLPWATEKLACVIFNLRTAHTPDGVESTRRTFIRLNDAALALGGRFFLTYHRYAPREQVERAYPRFAIFLERKRHYDPDERFTSDWYKHYAGMFG